MRVVITSPGGRGRDVTALVATAELTGDQRQAARTLCLGLLSAAGDSTIPEVECPLGSGVSLSADGMTFVGYVYSRTKNIESSILELRCMDRGFALKRIKVAKKLVETTAEAAAAQLCGEYGIPTGPLAATGVPLTRNFMGVPLYDILATLYSLAAEKTGKQYHLGFVGERFEVWEIGSRVSPVVLSGKTNLIGATTTEHVEHMVNSVLIHDDAGNMLGEVQNQESIGLYGLMQETLRQTKEDLGPKARELLETKGVSQKITLHNMGDASFVTGTAVTVREPVTGLFGRFFILSDTHTWARGLYRNKLVVDYKMTMEKKE